MLSSHQWLAVAAITSMVTTGWATIHQRHRLGLATITPKAMMRAHPACSDGRADTWLEMPWPTGP